MKLRDLMRPESHVENPFWIHAHIDDDGPRWFLARLCCVFGESELHVQFLWGDHEDNHFEDFSENYLDAPVVKITPPAAAPEGEEVGA